MKYGDKALFYSSILLFSESNMEKLSKSKVAIAGIGGVGAIVSELLVRNGIGNLKLSDIDPYEDKNLNRQLFATTETIGINKAVAGAQRLKTINPDSSIEVYDKGVNISNVEEFVKDVDVLVIQTDTESSKIIMHRMAKKHKIPVVCGSRGSILGHRWNVKAKVWNYKKRPDLAAFDETNHQEIAEIPFDKLTNALLNQYDEKIRQKKMKIFCNYARSKPEMFGSICQEDLLQRIDDCYNYYNRHVCSVLANTAGCLASTAVLRLILDGPDNDLEINLWTGESQENHYENKDNMLKSIN